jgi:pimeloyl-ACP methyl ester carboxylesterase
MIEAPELFLGMMAISPNFRELNDSEILFPKLSIPALRFFLDWLRGHGEIIFHRLAQPKIVRKILQTPYAVTIDDDLVALLLDPLIKTTGSCAVILDVMSYVRGPLPESQLAELSKCEKRNIPIIWVCYGTEDPWTPAARVKSLKRFASIEKVISVPETGHCPQDEAPDLFHQILLSFLKRLYPTRKATVENR